MMPHKIFEPDAFAAKAQEIRGRFSIEAEDTYFLDSGATAQNVPMDGMPVFVD